MLALAHAPAIAIAHGLGHEWPPERPWPSGRPASPSLRWPPMLIGCALAVLAHLLVLGGLQWVWGRPLTVPAAVVVVTVATPGPMAVRTLPPATADAATVREAATAAEAANVPEAENLPEAVNLPKAANRLNAVTVPDAATDPTPALPAPRPRARPAAAIPGIPSTPPAAPPAAARPPAVAPQPPSTPDLQPALPLPATLAALDAVDAEPVPTYRTLIPPAASLQFRFRRGSAASGSGELRWQPAADGHYQLDLEIRAGGPAPLLAQASRGGFDAAGLAPLRFTDKRLRRPTAAANFQRDAGRITFSGPPTAYPLLPGSQDRLSALLQLAAVVAAEPALRASGERVLIEVAGAHGDAAVWAFVRQETGGTGIAGGTDASSPPGEDDDPPVGHLAYRREPRGPYGLAITVWLDPQRGYLPSQVIWRSARQEDAYELRRVQDGVPRP